MVLVTVTNFIIYYSHLLGEFRFYTLTFVPSVFGSSFTAFLPHRVKHVYHTAIFQCLIESLLVQRGNVLTKSLSSSLKLQTLLFMSCSAVILLGKQQHYHNGFWFLAPESVPPKEASNLSLYVLQGMRKYLLIGLALDTFKALVSCFKSGHWQLKHLRLESMAWLGCYAGIYRATLCYLQRHQEFSEPQKQILGSFLGGISYICYPKLTILSYALLEAVRTLWAKNNRGKRKRLGYSDLIFPLSLAYLIHTYVLHPHKVSGLTAIIVDSSTANYIICLLTCDLNLRQAADELFELD
ncbi:hypothetical protein ACLKA6_009265 [Drosophila palustris]